MAHKLTDMKIRAITKPGLYGDGDNLYLQVTEWKPGRISKAWIFRYMLNGRSRDMGLGPLKTFSLAEARLRARKQRQQKADGLDPIDSRMATADAARAEAANRISFKDATEEFLAVHLPMFRNKKHRAQWRSTLERYAFPKLANRPVSSIDDALVNATVAGIWRQKPETASRVKQRILRIVRWIEHGKPLPQLAKTARVRHHQALPYLEIPELMAELRQRNSISAYALEFLILTAARTGEIIGSGWDEIDLKKKLWDVPAERTKNGRRHRVPLSDRAVEILKTVPREHKNPFIFPGGRAAKPLSNTALLELLRGLRRGFVVHGFRSGFRDWAAEQTSFPREIAEAALAHVLKNKVESAYLRTDFFEKRRRLMEAWSLFCTQTDAGNVTQLKLKKRQVS